MENSLKARYGQSPEQIQYYKNQVSKSLNIIIFFFTI